MLLYEQEILRCYNKLYRDELNLNAPFSFCTIIKDDEVYSLLKNEQQDHSYVPFGSSNASNNGGGDQGHLPSIQDTKPLTYEEKLLNSINEIKMKFMNFRVSWWLDKWILIFYFEFTWYNNTIFLFVCWVKLFLNDIFI